MFSYIMSLHGGVSGNLSESYYVVKSSHIEDFYDIVQLVFKYLDMPLYIFDTETSIFKVAVGYFALLLVFAFINWLFTR